MSIHSKAEEFIALHSTERGLNKKSHSAYSLDLRQFSNFLAGLGICDVREINKNTILSYIAHLNDKYKFSSLKRKLASVGVFLNYLEDEEYINKNYLRKIRIRNNRESKIPQIININDLERIFFCAYNLRNELGRNDRAYRFAVRDIALLEILFATGIRVSELCGIKRRDVDLDGGQLVINGKGSRQRLVPIVHGSVRDALDETIRYFAEFIDVHEYVFFNQRNRPITDQAVRLVITKYCDLAGINKRITPHMFRHTVATMLLENGVDIRIIQSLLGHSSISVTEIYTQVNIRPQREILQKVHPRFFLSC